MLELIEDVVISVVLIFCLAVLVLAAIAVPLYPLWVPVMMLVWALIRFWGWVG